MDSDGHLPVLRAIVVLAISLICTVSATAIAVAHDSVRAEAPVLVSPDDGARTTGATHPPVGVPTFQWSPVAEATKYHVQVSTSVGFADPLVDQDTYATTFTPVQTLADGVYYWRVKAQVDGQWGPYPAARSFTKDWSDGGTTLPQLLSPPQDATRAVFQSDDFSWSSVPGAATYRLEISTDPSFSNVTYTATTIKARHTPTERLANNVYYWRVIPIDHQGNFGLASAVGTFTFNWNLVPQLLSPQNSDILAFVPRYSWTAVEAAQEYRLEISTQPDFSSSSVYATDNTDYTPEKSLSNDQDYYWRVRAIDYKGNNGPWSAVNQFRIRWNFTAGLLTPRNNSTRVAYPFFSWTTIPGAERYRIQIDESTSFEIPIADEIVYNSTTYAHPRWATAIIDGDYYWRVRGIDAQNNLTPWSATYTFRPSYENSPTPVYPLYYYAPDSDNLPVHGDRTIAWPLFVWDTAHIYSGTTGQTQPPDYYELTVDDGPTFASPNFQIETAGAGAAPTGAHPFTGLQDGSQYYWRVRAYRGGVQMGNDSIWLTRYDSRTARLPVTDTLTLIYPADGFEAVGTPPVLGWLPVSGAGRYRVQVSRNRQFTDIVDEAEAQFVNYVPWQGRRSAMPYGTYWWRVRPENPNGDWSQVRHFNLSVDLLTGNPYDFVPPPRPGSLLSTTVVYSPTLTRIATSPGGGVDQYDVGALHVMQDRTYAGNYNWAIAFGVTSTVTGTVRYGIYFDTDHVDSSGATADPLGKPIGVDALYLPEYVLYVSRIGDTVALTDTTFYRWEGAGWSPGQTLTAIGGDGWYDAGFQAVQVLLPYSAIGAADVHFVGSVALAVFSTGEGIADGIHDSVPAQSATIDRPAFVSDMLMPLYPFDTPLSNPTVHYEMPTLRWRMPYFDSVDGYQVEVARDASFTDLVETWETYESGTWSYFALMPAAFQSKNAYEDNESYFWRVRIRHEKFASTFYDYGPWSSAMRFKLDSRQVSTPTLSTGTAAQMTPTFLWDRIETAAGYSLQVDDDANFSSPLVDKKVDGTSYTPTDMLQDGTYYWRVAMRRASKIVGHWTSTLSFSKSSPWPAPLSPINDVVVNAQPTLQWSAVLTPTEQPRLVAPRYRLQIAADPNFSAPDTYTTDATVYTLGKGKSLADGTWYWRVAVVDANNKVGPYSPTQRFYKEYLQPTLLKPEQGSTIGGIPAFEWQPISGAAYYKIQIADDELFNTPTTATTDNTRYTPTQRLANREYHWRVQMIDADNQPGPFERGKVTVSGEDIYLPLIVRHEE